MINAKWQRDLLSEKMKRRIARKNEILTLSGKIIVWIFLMSVMFFFGWHLNDWHKRDFKIHGMERQDEINKKNHE